MVPPMASARNRHDGAAACSQRSSAHESWNAGGETAAERHATRFVVTALLSAVLLADPAADRVRHVDATSGRGAAPSLEANVMPGGQPMPQIIATVGAVQLQLPVAQSAVTAIGYHQAGDGSLALDPVGRQGNAGVFARIWHRLAGAKENRLVWYQLRGDRGPGTSALAVGAAPGTDVYAPVDGTVVGITDFVLANRTYGARIDIRPHAAPSVVVSLTHLRADPLADGRLRRDEGALQDGRRRRPDGR